MENKENDVLIILYIEDFINITSNNGFPKTCQKFS
jgi:hypothetical protein